MLRYAFVVLFAVAGVSHALSDAEKAVKPKSECDKKASNCLSFPNSFKCSMAFKNLTKATKGNQEINILDIIPDLINQPGVTLTDEITEELDEREINFPAFDIADVCGNKITARKRSNARCYAFLQDYADEDIDSCDTGLITSDGEEINEGTVGDALCERMFNFTFPDEATRKKMYAESWGTGANYACKPKKPCPGKPFREYEKCLARRGANCKRPCPEKSKEWDEYDTCNKDKVHEGVTIGAYHSYCGTDWQEVATGSGKSRKPLNLKKTLCCQKKPDPVCKDGKILKTSAGSKGLARKLNTKKGQTCADFPLGFGCPCPELPMKPKYVTCEYLRGYNSKCAKKK